MLRIAVCGLDGIGKTTLIEKLKAKLTRDGLTVAQTRVPFTCKTLMENIGCENLNEFEIVRRIGMTFDFAEHYYKLDVAADVLICDRYDIDFEVLNDTYKIPENYKDIMHAIYAQAPRLDLCFYLKADYSLAAERLNKRGNRKENECDDILRSMQNSFEKRIKDYPNSVILDATKTEEEIANEAYKYILNKR
ncbi:MAG: deoxynucleoside kinase [Clostridia bacterium]|nr:deoxynucleoside kinase [Clostridia bacterium]